MGAINLDDEDDRGGGLTRLREQITHASRADSDERLDEVRARQREKGGVGLAGDGLREQRLAGARRSDQQHALRRRRAHVQIARGISISSSKLMKIFM